MTYTHTHTMYVLFHKFKTIKYERKIRSHKKNIMKSMIDVEENKFYGLPCKIYWEITIELCSRKQIK